MPANQRLSGYTLVASSTTAVFDALFFNFHNVVLASHLEVRQAIAMAINYQGLMASIPRVFAAPLCTDHGSFYHPGFDPAAPCPVFGEPSPPTGAVAGRYDIAEYQNSPPGYEDPDDSSLLSCNQFPPQGLNFDFYCNHALDALYQQELATPDPGLRQQIFVKIHQIYLTDFPFIVLFGAPAIFLVRKGTHNYQPNPLGLEDENVWEWWCDGGKC